MHIASHQAPVNDLRKSARRPCNGYAPGRVAGTRVNAYNKSDPPRRPQTPQRVSPVHPSMEDVMAKKKSNRDRRSRKHPLRPAGVI
jgi:hypothetical protein